MEQHATQLVTFLKGVSREQSWQGSGSELLNIAAVAAAASLSSVDHLFSEYSRSTSGQKLLEGLRNFNSYGQLTAS